MTFLMVPTHWQQHLPVLFIFWFWTPRAHRWRHVCTAASFPSEQSSPSPHLPILLTQTLLKPPIYTIHHPHPSVTAHPTALVPASLPPCFPPLYKTRIQLHLHPTPCSPSPWSLPQVAWGLLPRLEEKGQILTRSVFRQQLRGAEQAGLPPPTETSYHLPHDLP